MKNKIYYVSKARAEEIKAECLSDKGIFLAEIDGAELATEKDFVCAVWDAIQCPNPRDGYEKLGWLWDDLRELLWIKQPDVALIIHNFNSMLQKEQSLKEYILEHLYEITLPWWDGEVVGHMVGGEPRRFNVYLEVPEEEAGREYRQ